MLTYIYKKNTFSNNMKPFADAFSFCVHLKNAPELYISPIDCAMCCLKCKRFLNSLYSQLYFLDLSLSPRRISSNVVEIMD